MANKGQIVEIPASSLLYAQPTPAFASKKEELLWLSTHPMYSLFDGILIGGHNGIEHFKIGQRKGVNQYGGSPDPLFVIAIDKKDNRIFAGAGNQHPGLFAKVISLPQIFLKWQIDDPIDFPIDIEIEKHPEKDVLQAKLYRFDDNYFFEFLKPIEKTLFNNNFKILINQHIAATTELK